MRPVGMLIFCMAMAARGASAQTAVPVRELSAPVATSVQRFGAIESVRPQAKGGVLVNDTKHRQLVALDSTLQNFSVMLDSLGGGVVQYGRSGALLYPYLADSSVFPDGVSHVLVVVDDQGNFARRLHSPRPGVAPLLVSTIRGFDAEGNTITNGARTYLRSPSGKTVMPNEIPIARANYLKNEFEDIGQIKFTSSMRVQPSRDANGSSHFTNIINPLVVSDAVASLSDGTIAFIRGDDFRVEMIQPSGRKVSSPKLSSERVRLSDENKRHIVDSVRIELQATMVDSATTPRNGGAAIMAAVSAMGNDSLARLTRKSGGAFTVAISGGDNRGGGSGTLFVNGDSTTGRSAAIQPFSYEAPTIEFVPLREMSDYLPPFVSKDVKPDVDGNLWIHLTTFADAKPGESIYDVVNNRAQLVERVRVPAGRAIVGFGHDGVVFLKYQDGANGWALERVRLMH